LTAVTEEIEVTDDLYETVSVEDALIWIEAPEDGPGLPVPNDLTPNARALLIEYNSWKPSPDRGNILVMGLIMKSLVLADGKADGAFGLIIEVRNMTDGGDDAWASADHFFQSWVLRDQLPPLLAGPGASLANDGYHFAKMLGIKLEQDDPNIAPSPPTLRQYGWGFKGAVAAWQFPTNLKGRPAEELRGFLDFLPRGLHETGEPLR